MNDEKSGMTFSPAFPVGSTALVDECGLSKREYAAIHVSPQEMGVLDWDTRTCAEFLGIEVSAYDWEIHYPMVVAKRRFQFADAMLAESQK